MQSRSVTPYQQTETAALWHSLKDHETKEQTGSSDAALHQVIVKETGNIS